MSLTELDVARRIRDGSLDSPFKFHNMWLVNLRITGTGMAYRSSIGEHVWRNPDNYLNDEFLARCNGLSLIVNHPDELILNDIEFKDRIVGSVMLPYLKNDEAWGVCRVYSDDIVDEIRKGEVSTSPTVIFGEDSGNILINPEGTDEAVLLEGKPFLIDHIALVTKEHGTNGVWDKNSVPEGIDISNTGESDMTPEELKAALAGALADAMAPINKRLSAFEARADAADKKADEDRKEEEKAKADAARCDAEEKEKKEKEEKAKADSDEKRKEEEKAKADADEKAKADADEASRKTREEDDKDAMEVAKADEEKSEAQAKADSAYSSFGKRARPPMSGETVQAYRKRMIKGLQAYSDAYKGVNIDAITDDVLLGIAERQVYADAATFVNSGSDVPVGSLRPIKGRDSAGRETTRFVGDIGAFLAPFQIEAQQYAGRRDTTR